jgi:hypothetical protein
MMKVKMKLTTVQKTCEIWPFERWHPMSVTVSRVMLMQQLLLLQQRRDTHRERSHKSQLCQVLQQTSATSHH